MRIRYRTFGDIKFFYFWENENFLKFPLKTEISKKDEKINEKDEVSLKLYKFLKMVKHFFLFFMIQNLFVCLSVP